MTPFEWVLVALGIAGIFTFLLYIGAIGAIFEFIWIIIQVIIEALAGGAGGDW